MGCQVHAWRYPPPGRGNRRQRRHRAPPTGDCRRAPGGRCTFGGATGTDVALTERSRRWNTVSSSSLPTLRADVSLDHGELTFIGTATVLLRYGGFTVLTDPNFLHQGEHAPLGGGLRSRRLTDPAFEIADLPPLDVIVLSHHHGDHFDDRAARELPKHVPIVTTRHAARKLGRQGFTDRRPLATWQTQTLRRGGRALRIDRDTGTPHARAAQQGPSSGHGQCVGVREPWSADAAPLRVGRHPVARPPPRDPRSLPGSAPRPVAPGRYPRARRHADDGRSTGRRGTAPPGTAPRRPDPLRRLHGVPFTVGRLPFARSPRRTSRRPSTTWIGARRSASGPRTCGREQRFEHIWPG